MPYGQIFKITLPVMFFIRKELTIVTPDFLSSSETDRYSE